MQFRTHLQKLEALLALPGSVRMTTHLKAQKSDARNPQSTPEQVIITGGRKHNVGASVGSGVLILTGSDALINCACNLTRLFADLRLCA